MVVQGQKIFSILSHHPVSGRKVANAPFSQRHPSWPGLLLNRQFLLARLRRAFLQDSPTPRGSLRFAHRGLISFTPPACKPAARKGCEDISPGLSEAIPGVTATLYATAR